ncbi:MAG: 3-hydroxyacyl-CoA dehydrogenase [Gemmatimonadetes bacterium]|nr:3-hydroxyacyl-CoA dehydrogenase [Gemmatimonadota bacterium]
MQEAGSTALVTGGASGLGAATARMLVARGARVVIADLNEQAGLQLAAELGAQAVFVRTDVTVEGQVRAAVDQAARYTGTLRILVTAAGIGTQERLLGKAGPHDLQRFTQALEVNLIGTFDVVRQTASVMVNNSPNHDGERGVIITTASVAAFEGQIGQVAYAASKAGIVGMTLPLARELARFGIRVVTIAPGIFDTPLLATIPEEAKTTLASQVPFPARLGHPSEYAALVEHIIQNPMLNGETIRLDGAIRMAPR